MKSLRHYIPRLLTALSLLFGAAVVVLWVLSWRRPSCITAEASLPSGKGSSVSQWQVELFTMRGGIDVRGYWRSGGGRVAGAPTEYSMSSVSKPQRLCERAATPSIWNRAGFLWETGTPRGSFFMPRSAGESTHFVFAGVPYWFIACLAAVWPGWRIARRRRAASLAASGHCPVCGYDLRATPARCPECGATKNPGFR